MRDLHPPRRLRRLACIVALVALALGTVGAAPDGPGDGSGDLVVEAVSTRAGAVTGGDVLVDITVPEPLDTHALRVSVDGRDVSGAFAALDDPRHLRGLVDGLALGPNLLEARAGGSTATLSLVNHPVTGPIFSGPHQQPFVCETEAAGLGAALDEHCSIATTGEYWYRSGGGWAPLEDPADAPANVPTVTTLDGHTVPFIVRVETGTINRAIYRIAVLDDGTYASTGEVTDGWNRKLVYTYGGGCDAGYRQGTTVAEDVLLPAFLQRGYAVATSSLNVGVVNCNDVVSAETTMMVKERFSETYGVPRYTIGQGGSGGAIQTHLIAENYPGLLDGILPNSAFPDAISIGSGISDCRLLNTYFAGSTVPWTEAQRTAVTGFAINPIPVCESIDGAFGDTVVAEVGCRIPDELVYHRTDNPTGARCTVFDHLVNVFGADPATGFARRSLDNIGVQYGLAALNDGRITIEQFLDLNASIGGYDIDGNLAPERSEGDVAAVEAAYRTGRVVSGTGGLATTPAIVIAGYKDHLANPHDRFRNFSMQQRLVRANGDAGTYIIWTYMGTPGTGGFDNAMLVMDQWLEDLLADPTDDDQRTKVLRARPAKAQDACWVGDRYDEPQSHDEPGVCSALYHSHADPRLVSGAPVTNDVLKCQLKAVDPADYTLPLTPMHLERLRGIFPAGVCDHGRPGLGQDTYAGTWQTFGG